MTKLVLWGDTKLEIFNNWFVAGLMYVSPFVFIFGVPWLILVDFIAKKYVVKGLLYSPILIEFPCYMLSGLIGGILVFIFFGFQPILLYTALLSSIFYMIFHSLFRGLKKSKMEK